MKKNAKNQPSQSSAIKIIAENRKAKFDYHIHEKIEAGLVLTGSEVKSLRAGKATLANSYADIKNNEVYLLQTHIAPYEKGGYANHDPMRKRKLLLHRKEIIRLAQQLESKGMTAIPLKLYFKNSKAKVELGIAVGKKAHDKRDAIKEREAHRDIARNIKRR